MLASQLDAIYIWVEQVDVLIKSDLVLNYKLNLKSLCVNTKFSDCVGQDTLILEYVHNYTWAYTHMCLHCSPHMNTQHSTHLLI